MTNDTRVPTSVYLYYDKNDFLVYVGITSRGMNRQREHNSTKTWWQYVVRQDVEHYPTRPSAEDREKRLITKHQPPFNKVHNPNHKAAQAAYVKQVSQSEALNVHPAKVDSMKNRLSFEAANAVGDIVTLVTDLSDTGLNALAFDTPKLVISSGGRKAKLVDSGTLPTGLWVRVKTADAHDCKGALVMTTGETRRNTPRPVKRIDLFF